MKWTRIKNSDLRMSSSNSVSMLGKRKGKQLTRTSWNATGCEKRGLEGIKNDSTGAWKNDYQFDKTGLGIYCNERAVYLNFADRKLRATGSRSRSMVIIHISYFLPSHWFGTKRRWDSVLVCFFSVISFGYRFLVWQLNYQTFPIRWIWLCDREESLYHRIIETYARVAIWHQLDALSETWFPLLEFICQSSNMRGLQGNF